MYGAVGNDRYDEPITEYVKLMADSPGGETLRARITSIVQAGDAASATVVDDGVWGTLSFVTFLTLSRIEGRWRIVNKNFAHTGRDARAGAKASPLARVPPSDRTGPESPGRVRLFVRCASERGLGGDASFHKGATGTTATPGSAPATVAR
jgi:hypothetical protein